MKNISIVILLTLLITTSISLEAQTVQGTVFEAGEGKAVPLTGVNVYWSGTQIVSVSDENGNFQLRKPDKAHMLVFSFVGFKSDTIHVHDDHEEIQHIMRENITLGEVEVSSRAKTSFVSKMSTVNAVNITSGELSKAACCNLSESFETSASVDVSYSDAVTGAKQIEMLGLSGIYSQMMAENMPNLRGLATSFGLAYVPGSWMESIQVSKGTSSVINGYESISGQINIEYKKPDNSERFFLNLFQDQMGRSELNFNTRYQINSKLGTMLLGHVSHNGSSHDDNHDGFMDEPKSTQFNLFNRWDYHGNRKEFQFGIKAMKEMRDGGQYSFDASQARDTSNGYGVQVNTERAEAFLKTGFIFKRHLTSLGIQQQFVYHHLNSYFGLNDYIAGQYSYYANALFQSYIGNSKHTYTAGASFIYDKIDEQLNDSTFGRIETVPGVFYQYTFSDGKNLNIIAGLRADYHSMYGLFFTPRLHIRYNFSESLILRLSAGKGSRSANVLAENTSLLATSRRITFLNSPKMEEAWNYGLNLSKSFELNNRELSLSIDVYRTDFTHQVIIDRDSDAYKILIYNLDGKSFSNSVQAEANYELFKGFDVTAAVRYSDVHMTFSNELLEKPLINKYKGLLNLSYVTNLKKWQFDFTSQFIGPSRLPATVKDASTDRESPAYVILNAQITKYFKKWNIYLGSENLTDYKQHHPIIAADAPFSEAFDSSVIWGPISGIKVYAGLRYSIE
jgi:outer membrane receptor for ferrienterochelin and colicin